MTGKREATSAVQEGLSELSSEYLGAIGPQQLNTPGSGDKNNNLSTLVLQKEQERYFYKERIEIDS